MSMLVLSLARVWQNMTIFLITLGLWLSMVACLQTRPQKPLWLDKLGENTNEENCSTTFTSLLWAATDRSFSYTQKDLPQ